MLPHQMPPYECQDARGTSLMRVQVLKKLGNGLPLIMLEVHSFFDVDPTPQGRANRILPRAVKGAAVMRRPTICESFDFSLPGQFTRAIGGDNREPGVGRQMARQLWECTLPAPSSESTPLR